MTRHVPPADADAVLSPADGRIVVVEKVRDPYLERDALKISVFMNVFNVHSNRSPVDGEVKERWYTPGKFVNADLDKASLENERNALWLADGRRRRHLRAGRRPDRAPHPVLRASRATRWRAASATASSASARAWTSTCRRRRARGRVWATRCPAGVPYWHRLAKPRDHPCPNPSPQNRLDATRGLRRRGIYLLPNLFTTGALFAGFYAIVQAMNSRFEHAAVAIFIAMVLDGLDGRVARLTHTQSAFGAEYDSLSDMVSFGVAPALVIYDWALKGMGKLGWIAAFVYCAGAALRLARFNTQLEVADKRYFQGLPSPAAAALIAGLVWVMHDYGITGQDVRWLAWGSTLFAGLTMVSNIRFYSGKDINLRKSVPFFVILLVVLAFILVSTSPPEVLFCVFVLYALSGYVDALIATACVAKNRLLAPTRLRAPKNDRI